MDDLGFLEITQEGGGKGKTNRYRVISTEDESKPFYTMKNSITPEICKKKLEEWLKRYCHTEFVSYYTKFSRGSREKKLFSKGGETVC